MVPTAGSLKMFWPGLTTRHPHSLSVGSSGTPLQRPQRPQEGDWDAEDRALLGFQQAPFSELPPPIHVLQESGLPDADPSQVGAGLEGHGPCAGLFGLPCLGLRPHGTSFLYSPLVLPGQKGFQLLGLYTQPGVFLPRFTAPTCHHPWLSPQASCPMHWSASPQSS